MIHKTLVGTYIDASKILAITEVSVKGSEYGSLADPRMGYFDIMFQLQEKPVRYSVLAEDVGADIYDDGTIEEKTERIKVETERHRQDIIEVWKKA